MRTVRGEMLRRGTVCLDGQRVTGRADRLCKNIQVARDRVSKMSNRIIAAIQKVPRGWVSTYGAIAKAAGYPRGARLVARTLRGAGGLPWHRILGAGGEIKLRGHSGQDQRLRLEMEGVTFRGRRVNMRLHEFKFGGSRKKTVLTAKSAKKGRKGR
jgi:methylated-DNA-protein-cysteine methyltransferase related protein